MAQLISRDGSHFNRHGGQPSARNVADQVTKKPRDHDSPAVNEILDADPAPIKRKADEGSKSIRNHLTTLETRRAKCKRSLQV